MRRLSTDIPNDGDVERVRIQFVETAQYAGISVSPRLNWFWRISYINPPPINRPPHPPIDLKFLPLNDVANDNVLEAARYKPNKNTLVLVSDATTLLTLDLKQSTVPQGFMVAGSGPGTATRGPANVLWTIDGAMLDAGAPCQPYAYMVREQSGETDGDRTIIPFNITNSTATRLSGNYSVPNGALLGEYTIYVFLRDAVRISPNRTVIMDP